MKTVKPKICIVSATPITIYFFFQNHIKELSKDFDVTIVYNSEIDTYIPKFNLKAEEKHIKIERQISLINDISALYALYKYLRSEKFSAVISIAPKAGLLSMIAAYLSKIETRIHIFQGEVWANKKGFFRLLLKSMDIITATLSNNVLAVSFGEKNFLIKEKVVKKDKCNVIANGSICGVEVLQDNKYHKDKDLIKREIGFNQKDIICLFVGRLHKDKGIDDLINAFKLNNSYSNLKLLIVGPDEDNLKNSKLWHSLEDKLTIVDYTPEPEKYFCICDFLCLPSHREGFGMVILEAASFGIPSIGSNIYGIQDAIKNNETGLLFEKSNIKDLSECIKKLYLDENLRKKMGHNAKQRAIHSYSKKYVVDEYTKYFKEVIK